MTENKIWEKIEVPQELDDIIRNAVGEGHEKMRKKRREILLIYTILRMWKFPMHRLGKPQYRWNRDKKAVLFRKVLRIKKLLHRFL